VLGCACAAAEIGSPIANATPNATPNTTASSFVTDADDNAGLFLKIASTQ